MNKPNHYAILNVSPSASDKEIRRAYKLLSKQEHSKKKTRDINAAYAVLSDPGARKNYDDENPELFEAGYAPDVEQGAVTHKKKAPAAPVKKFNVKKLLAFLIPAVALVTAFLLVLFLVILPSVPSPVKIGKVYGQDITSKDLDYMLNGYCWYTGYDRDTLVTSADEAKTLYESMLDSYVEFQIAKKVAADRKIVLSADDIKAIDADLKSRLDALLAPLESSYADIAKTKTSVDPKKEAQKALDEQMQKNGFTTEDMRRFLTDIKYYQLVIKNVQDAVTLSDADLKDGYDKLLAKQKETFTNLAAYEYTKAMAEQGQGDPVVYVPSGMRYVKHILISLPDEVINQYQSAADDAARKKLRDDNLPGIKPKADEALAKVQAGGDFDALMAQYGQDPGMQSEPAKTKGYELGKETSFVQEFKDAALALAKPGDVTGLVATDYGYHIIKYVGDVASGPVPFDQVKDVLKSGLLAEKKNKAWDDTIAQWKKDAGVETDISKMPLPSFSPTPAPSVAPTTPAPSASPAVSPAPSESAAPSESPAASPAASATPAT